MARRPARLERAGALTPRDRMWSAIRALQGDGTWFFSPVEVHFLTNLRAPQEAHVHVDSVISYMEALSRAEPPYVVRAVHLETPRTLQVGRKRSELHSYRMARDVGVEAPRVTSDGKPVTDGAANDQMWQAMKVLREFDYVDLAHSASTSAQAVSPQTAKTYLRFLERAGYVVVSKPSKGGTGATKALYRFNRARNSGPRAPLVCKDKSVMDANSGQVVYRPGGSK